MKSDDTTGRRQFLGGLARTAAALAVGGGLWSFTRRTGSCVNAWQCAGCDMLPDCSLPEAALARDAGPDAPVVEEEN